MKQIWGLAGASITAWLLCAASPAQEASEPRALIDKAIRAMGGEANLTKFKGMTWKEKGTFYGMGEGVPYSGSYALELPNRFRMEIDNAFIIVLDGDQGWVESNGQVRDMGKEQLDAQKEAQYARWVASLLPLKDQAFSLKALPDTKVGERSAAGVVVSHKGHRDVTLYFDKETGRLIRIEHRERAGDQGGKEVSAETGYQDYKEFQGVQCPTKVVIKRDGKPFVDAEAIEIKLMEKVDPVKFAKPKP
jgi:hypothetical protein